MPVAPTAPVAPVVIAPVVIPPALPEPTLPIPYPKPLGGTLPYGSVVRFAADSLPGGVTLEYSLNNDPYWQTADSVVLRTGASLRIRSRKGNYVSGVRTASYSVSFKRVLLVGNSITLHTPQADIGWLGNWGMAASAPDRDYVHILTGRLQTLDPQVTVEIYNGGPFERQFWTFDYGTVRSVAAFKPDLVVMRIGENVPTDAVTSRNFGAYYQRLVDSLTVRYAPVKVVCTTSFFDQPATSDVIRQVAAARKFYLADFAGLVNDPSLRAAGLFTDAGVAAHPGDKGMLAIADLIWDKVH